MDLTGGWVLPVTWAGLGLVIVVSSLLAARHRAAHIVGVVAVSLLWVAAGAGANLAMLLDGTTYTGFASGSPIAFVRDTWESLVVPHHHVFIGLLIAFEAIVGLTVLWPGRPRTIALSLLIAFNLTLVVFGWGFLIWALPLSVALLLLLRAPDRHSHASRRGPHGADPEQATRS